MYRLLLIDDDRKLCSMLSRFLEGEGFICECAYDGAAGLQKATQTDYDVLVLDVMMPKINGFEVVKRLRKIKNTPILMLTARGDEDDSIVGLEIGADDYLSKPCNPKVLSARLRAVLRRIDAFSSESSENFETVSVGDVTILPGTRTIKVGGKPLDLTNTEFKILTLLIRSAGKVVEKETLSQIGLGRKLNPFDRSIDFHISSLRRKLGETPEATPRILTVRGEGYMFGLLEEG
ncbi:MAG: response regulator transcription factor [Magnetococcales bacterium]|nr:response regulator transcription factor [Magnetococcales bacterium]